MENGAVARSDFSLWRQSYFLLQSLLEMLFKIYILKKGTQKSSVCTDFFAYPFCVLSRAIYWE